MKNVLIFAVVIFILILGYSTIIEKGEVTIKVGIDKYTPAMSSVPGIPLTPEYRGEEAQKRIEYQWNTEEGQFITWDNSIVSGQGKEITNEGSKIYWTVDFEEKEEETPFDISLKVINTETGKIIAKTKIQIQKDSDGFYIVK